MQFGGTYRINQVSLIMLILGKVMGQNGPPNINYSMYQGHTFIGHNSAIFCPIELIFLVTQEILMLFWKKSNFWRENGRGRHRGVKGSGASSPDQKVGPLGGPFGSTAITKKFGSEQKERLCIFWVMRSATFNFMSAPLETYTFSQNFGEDYCF